MNRERATLRTLLKILSSFEALPVAGVLVVVYVVFMRAAPDVFLKPRIYMSFLQTAAPPLIVGLGLTLVITAGEIDLSFPAVLAFSGFVFNWAFKTFDGAMGVWISLLLALGAGGLIGYINGLLVARIGVPSIMATLASQFTWNGITVLLAAGLQATLKNIDESLVFKIFVGRINGIVPDQDGNPVGLPSQALWGLGLAVFLWFILNRHRFGEAIMFIGDSPNVASVMGINVEATKVRLFTLMGVITAFAGVILTLQARVFYPTQGGGMLLPVMAAVFIGGTSIAGGQGLIVGTFFGSYIIVSLEAGVVATKISGYYVQLVVGLVMATAIILHVVLEGGSISAITNRLRQWSALPKANSSDDTAQHYDTPLK